MKCREAMKESEKFINICKNSIIRLLRELLDKNWVQPRSTNPGCLFQKHADALSLHFSGKWVNIWGPICAGYLEPCGECSRAKAHNRHSGTIFLQNGLPISAQEFAKWYKWISIRHRCQSILKDLLCAIWGPSKGKHLYIPSQSCLSSLQLERVNCLQQVDVVMSTLQFRY